MRKKKNRYQPSNQRSQACNCWGSITNHINTQRTKYNGKITTEEKHIFTYMYSRVFTSTFYWWNWKWVSLSLGSKLFTTNWLVSLRLEPNRVDLVVRASIWSKVMFQSWKQVHHLSLTCSFRAAETRVLNFTRFSLKPDAVPLVSCILYVTLNYKAFRDWKSRSKRRNQVFELWDLSNSTPHTVRKEDTHKDNIPVKQRFS